jgi:phage protein D
MAGQERGQMGDTTGSQYAERFGSNAVLANDHNLTSNAEAKALALAHLEKRSLDFITGHGSCIGMPELVARIVVNLQGLGKRFSGNYYVTSATHTIDAGGYRTEFDVKRNARNDS